MSQSATLSPSPAGLSNFFNNPRNTLPFTPPNFRRRTSHPHNIFSQRSSTDMADSSQSHRPRLEHRQSQTVVETIDLTEDGDGDDEFVVLPNVPRRAARRPQLGRSDAGNLTNLVDLTSDGDEEPDIVITGARELPEPRRRQQRPREPSEPLFVPQAPNVRLFDALPRPGAFELFRGAVNTAAGGAIRHFLQDHMQGWGADVAAIAEFGGQAMPGPMNYHHAAFGVPERDKPEYVRPPPVPAGYVRSPDDGDVIVCPSCGDELVHEHEQEVVGPVSKKAPTRKDMEEHPFWVVKECGHVYCNRCYQFRGHATKVHNVHFRETTRPAKKTKNLACNVDDCTSDVKTKDKWVGVFL